MRLPRPTQPRINPEIWWPVVPVSIVKRLSVVRDKLASLVRILWEIRLPRLTVECWLTGEHGWNQGSLNISAFGILNNFVSPTLLRRRFWFCPLVFTLVTWGRLNVEPNGGIFDVAPKDDRASPNVKSSCVLFKFKSSMVYRAFPRFCLPARPWILPWIRPWTDPSLLDHAPTLLTLPPLDPPLD